MPDPRFFLTLSKPLSLEQAAVLTGGALECAASEKSIGRVAALAEKDLSGAVVYCADRNAADVLGTRQAALCITTQKVAGNIDSPQPLLLVESPRLAFALIANELHRSIEDPSAASGTAASVSQHAHIHSTAIVGAGAEIAAGAKIGAYAYIGKGVTIGEEAVISAHASVTHARIGNRVHVLDGARIGQAGFGFVEGPEGLVRVPQLGCVVIDDDVEIGANTAIDRGALEDTHIGAGTKIDNLVQIGHNVRIGRNCVIAAHSGISGSCVIGDGVMMGGQVGLSDHLVIGSGAKIAAGSGLMRDVPAGEKWGGRPARPIKEWLKETAVLAKLAKKKNGSYNGENRTR